MAVANWLNGLLKSFFDVLVEFEAAV